MQREGEIAVEILMQAVEVAGDVLQQKAASAGSGLGRDTPSENQHALRIAHDQFPCARSSHWRWHDPWIKRGPKTANQCGQWIFEIAVFAFAKAMSRHVDVASKMNFVIVKPGDCTAFFL